MRWGTRKRIGRTYYRNYTATVDERGPRARFTSHGIRIPLGPLGSFTKNLTTGRWSWDHPGPGAISGGGKRGRR